MDLSNVSLLSLQTSFMQQDKTTQALCAALEPYFRELADDVKACLIYARVDELDAPVLDELAWQMDLDFWDGQADVARKRELIKSALIIHMTKGTPYAVERLITTLFGDGQVVEWFDYGGQPYYFKVTTNNPAATQERAQEFIRALNGVKNARSWLEKVEIIQTESLSLFYAGVVYTGDNLTIRQVV